MTVDEAKKREQVLAAGIIELIQQFEDETGLVVRDIELLRDQSLMGTALRSLSLTVTLD